MSGLPADDIRAISALQQLLAHDADPIDRHFMHAQLENLLYRARNAFASALDEYDQACRDHDGEMDAIRQALQPAALVAAGEVVAGPAVGPQAV